MPYAVLVILRRILKHVDDLLHYLLSEVLRKTSCHSSDPLSRRPSHCCLRVSECFYQLIEYLLQVSKILFLQFIILFCFLLILLLLCLGFFFLLAYERVCDRAESSLISPCDYLWLQRDKPYNLGKFGEQFTIDAILADVLLDMQLLIMQYIF